MVGGSQVRVYFREEVNDILSGDGLGGGSCAHVCGCALDSGES